MPIIRVFGLSSLIEIGDLNLLRMEICEAVVGIQELKVTEHAEITTHFLSELAWHHPSEITAEVSLLYKKPERTKAVQDRLSKAIAEGIGRVLTHKEVYCSIAPLFDPKKQGHYLKKLPPNAKRGVFPPRGTRVFFFFFF